MPRDGRTTVVVANPSADVYGSDLQMLQSVAAMRAEGWRVVVAVPADGPLCAQLREIGAEVVFVGFPVLRRSEASVLGVLRMACRAGLALPRIRRLVRRLDPSFVYVNTVTLPWWLLAARSARTPTVCHVHEAEVNDHTLVRKALAFPLRLATAFIVVSRSALDAVCDVDPALRPKANLVYNCVPEPTPPPSEAEPHPPWRLVVIGRLSPRKAPHIALEATAQLRRRGRDVELLLCGSGLPVHARYVAALHERAAQPDLEGAVEFAGYSSPVWPALARSNVLLAPSRGESFGLAVVEAQLALRPVVASAVQGHLETVEDGRTGLLVPVDDAPAIVAAVERLMDDPGLLTRRLVRDARAQAAERFSVARYRKDLVSVLSALPAPTAPYRPAHRL